MSETELQRAERQFAQAKARLQAVKNREATRQRKLDTRRKVILGGALIDLAVRDSTAAEMLDRLLRNLTRENDRQAFEEWSPPSVGSGSRIEAGAGSDADVGSGSGIGAGVGSESSSGSGDAPSATPEPPAA
ncbi:hypothetical protein [Limimaricola cinnabarinus]|uniref:Mobilization protein n=1 Tax=Limimaricola cinnabarinus LL-001 TaxID=1337093 RepID=U2YPC5_9RHOB|nr:hypothetical protein [Limimaricola cinnabarinus]GAD57241.1 mobilization protein [Limimaricola cinnabarinus LL-001]